MVIQWKNVLFTFLYFVECTTNVESFEPAKIRRDTLVEQLFPLFCASYMFMFSILISTTVLFDPI